MRISDLLIKTRHEAPADETSKNAQLLTRAGYIHKEMAGVYSFLPLGQRVIEKISQIVREEMNAIGGAEVRMSTLQSKELWEATDRWGDDKIDNWFKSQLKNGTEVGIGLTHEEPLVNAMKNYVSSYKDLPIYPYQIQTKFRNELRAKSGLLRGREFLMKDLYSFSRSQQEHDEFYDKTVADAYMKVYERLGLGSITFKCFASGGYFSKYSTEFQTVSPIGEDTIYLDRKKKLAVNKEVYNDEVLADLGLKKDELEEVKAVEVGNIFPLGSRFSDALGLKYTDEQGKQQSVVMGSYGIGISRLMGLLAEHFADDKGLVWPVAAAPFRVHIVRLGNDPEVIEAADKLYDDLLSNGVEALYDDRGESPGSALGDADLIGIPYRVVVSPKTVGEGKCELFVRGSTEPAEMVELAGVKNLLTKKTLVL